jgi:hypothetical protein
VIRLPERETSNGIGEARYHAYLSQKNDEFESICRRCGSCCGSGDDPCEKLRKDVDGGYYCLDYQNRLKPQLTISGRSFHCVPIREHIKAGTLRSGCAYRS